MNLSPIDHKRVGYFYLPSRVFDLLLLAKKKNEEAKISLFLLTMFTVAQKDLIFLFLMTQS